MKVNISLLAGQEHPDHMWVRCVECGEGFWLSRGKDNVVCEHLGKSWGRGD